MKKRPICHCGNYVPNSEKGGFEPICPKCSAEIYKVIASLILLTFLLMVFLND